MVALRGKEVSIKESPNKEKREESVQGKKELTLRGWEGL